MRERNFAALDRCTELFRLLIELHGPATLRDEDVAQLCLTVVQVLQVEELTNS